MESFSAKGSKCSIVATLSPSAADTEHSISTLRTVSSLAALPHSEHRQEVQRHALDEANCRTYICLQVVVQAVAVHAPTAPSKWSVKQVRPSVPHMCNRQLFASQVQEWLLQVDDGRFSSFVATVPGQLDGKTLCRWNVLKFNQICAGNEKKGGRLYSLLRAEMDHYSNSQKMSRDNRRNVR